MPLPSRTERPAALGVRPASSTGTGGFTLIEVIIVLGMLVVVLTAAYRIFLNVLETERTVERVTMPEKVGEGILSLIRRDLAGAFYKGATEGLNRQVFLGVDREGTAGADDRLFFLTTTDPTPREDLLEWTSVRSTPVVGYFLEPNEAVDGLATFTLYRKEITDFSSGQVLDAPGMNFVVYDKVKALDFEYYDGYDWYAEWSSEQQILAQEQDELLRSQESSRLPQRLERVSDTSPTAGVDPNAPDPTYVPPPPIPVAVRIRLEIYAAIGSEVYLRGDEPITRTFTSIVPILASRRIPLNIETDQMDLAGAGGAGGAAGATPATTVQGGPTPGGPGGGRARTDRSFAPRGGAGGSARPTTGVRGGGRGAVPSAARGAVPGGGRGGGAGSFGAGRVPSGGVGGRSLPTGSGTGGSIRR